MRSTKPSYYSLRSFFRYLRNYKARLVVITLCFGIADVAIAVIPIFIGKLVGALAMNPINEHGAILYMWILIACSVLHSLLWHGSEMIYQRYIIPLGYHYETALFEHVMTKPYPYFVDKFTGKLSSYITSSSRELRELLDNIFYNYISQAINVVAIIFILSSINWQSGAIFAIGVLLMVLIGRKTIGKSIAYEKTATDVLASKNGILIDAIANFVNVKSFQKEQSELAVIRSQQRRTVKAAQDSFRWSIVFWASMTSIVRGVIWPATIGMNVYLFLHHQLTIAQFATLLSTLLIFSSTIWDVVWYLSQFNLKVARIEEAHTYLFGPTLIDTGVIPHVIKSTDPLNFNQTLELHDIHFAYPDKTDTPVLRHINLTIQKGEKIGIVGRSGSGKTTLTKLLLGYYETANESIIIDGEAVQGSRLASVISYVPQDTSLFHRTIAENIAYASNDSVTRDDIIAAAQKAHAHEFIVGIHDGYDALVGERGVKLSAGQRQRIAIARAFLDNKPLLILDEATSALDSESEVLVQQGLEALWKEKTVIAIAHRLSTLRHMDKIIVMDKGQIIESGSHSTLLAQNGSYAKLWNHQSGGFIEE